MSTLDFRLAVVEVSTVTRAMFNSLDTECAKLIIISPNAIKTVFDFYTNSVFMGRHNVSF